MMYGRNSIISYFQEPQYRNGWESKMTSLNLADQVIFLPLATCEEFLSPNALNCRLSHARSLLSLAIMLRRYPRCFLKASLTDIPFFTSSLTRSSASTNFGSISTTSDTFSSGITITPLTASLNTKSPGLTTVPSRSRGT